MSMQGFHVPPPRPPPRGPLLTWLLGAITMGSILDISATVLLFGGAPQSRPDRDRADLRHARAKRILAIVLFAGVARLACAAGMWTWKQWGVLGYIGLALLQVFLSAKLDPHHQPAYGRLVWVALVLAAALPKWSRFER